MQIRHVWSQIQVFLFFHEILCLKKFERADFKYDNSFLKILARKYLHKAFLVANVNISEFAFKQIRGFSSTNSSMTIASNSRPKIPKYEIRHFLSQIQAFLSFCKILQLDKFEGADFKYDNIVFKFHSKSTQIRYFWSQILEFLVLHQTLQQDKFKDANFKYDNVFFKFQSKNT